jgi:hypothetical protein
MLIPQSRTFHSGIIQPPPTDATTVYLHFEEYQSFMVNCAIAVINNKANWHTKQQIVTAKDSKNMLTVLHCEELDTVSPFTLSRS